MLYRKQTKVMLHKINFASPVSHEYRRLFYMFSTSYSLLFIQTKKARSARLYLFNEYYSPFILYLYLRCLKARQEHCIQDFLNADF